MKIHRARLGLGAAVFGAALAMAPAIPAWAGVHKSSSGTSAKSSKGSDPNGSFCRLEKSVLSDENSKVETAATNAMVAGNWTVAQKDLIAIDKQTGKLETAFISTLSKAPKNVKSAAAKIIKIVPAEEKAVEDSTSVSQFEQEEEAVTNSSFNSAAKVLQTWDVSQCGSITTTTT
jgi:tetrahydromethanopterin S-methyltransferase subunit H